LLNDLPELLLCKRISREKLSWKKHMMFPKFFNFSLALITCDGKFHCVMTAVIIRGDCNKATNQPAYRLTLLLPNSLLGEYSGFRSAYATPIRLLYRPWLYQKDRLLSSILMSGLCSVPIFVMGDFCVWIFGLHDNR
jgi:hypothetical protein